MYVFTQDNLEETMNHLMENVNIDKDLKNEVFKINWKIEDESKYKKLLDDKNETVIFIKGNEKYIQKVNRNLEQIKSYKNIEIVDCYSLEEVGCKAEEIKQNYNHLLMTNGKIKM